QCQRSLGSARGPTAQFACAARRQHGRPRKAKASGGVGIPRAGPRRDEQEEVSWPSSHLSMVVRYLDLLRPLIAPPEYDPPLIIYSDRMLASEVPSQSFQSVAWWRRKITKHCRVIQLHQLSAGYLGDNRRKPLWNASLLENQSREHAPEASDHRPVRIMP